MLLHRLIKKIYRIELKALNKQLLQTNLIHRDS
nr:MAG TPA: hypothetical protein [Crassvirales sp.]